MQWVCLCCDTNENMEEERLKQIEQFAKKVHHFSSQYGSETSISYTVTNLAGMCTRYPHYGDFTQTCVFRTYGPWWQISPSVPKGFSRLPDTFNSVDYVELIFSEPVIPTSIEVFETYNPGAVVRILAYALHRQPSKRDCSAAWITLWRGSPERAPPKSRIFSPPLKQIKFPTNLIRLELNPVLCHYYPELDAVRLTGLESRLPLPAQTLQLSVLQDPPADYDSALREYGSPVDPFPLPGTSGYDDSEDEDSPAGRAAAASKSQPQKSEGTPAVSQGAAYSQTGAVTVPTAGDSSYVTKSCSESLANDLSRLHLADGLSAALDPSDNGCFDLLPGELIQNILFYLDTVSLCRLSQTCRLLQQHCYDPLQYMELSLKPFWHSVSDQMLDSLHTRCRYSQRIDLSWCGGFTSVTSVGFSRFLDACGGTLTTLHLASCRFINHSCIAAISNACPILEDLDLQSCNRTVTSGKAFLEISKLTRLRRLNLYRTFIDLATITIIIESCHELEYLNLGSCASISDFDNVVSAVANNCKKIRFLDLWRAKSLSDTGLRALASNCPMLEELDVGWCPNLNSWTELAKKCRNMRKLFLTANRTICDADLDAFAQNCPKLEQLDILGTREVSPRIARKILDHCQNLRFFDVSFCFGITAEVVEAWESLYPHVAIKRSFQT